MNGTIALSATRPLSDAEELANSFTHGIGFVMSLAGAALMTTTLGTQDAWRIAGCSIYLTSLVAVYLMSTLSHVFQEPRLRTLFRSLDQGSIYLLVAGTYTPFALAYLSGGWLVVLALVWSIAAWGFITKVLFAYRVENVSMWPCVVMGALPFVTLPAILQSIPLAAAWPMVLGCGFYVLGLYFWLNDRKVRHFHAVWHVLVVAGSAAHFVGILQFVVRGA